MQKVNKKKNYIKQFIYAQEKLNNNVKNKQQIEVKGGLIGVSLRSIIETLNPYKKLLHAIICITI